MNQIQILVTQEKELRSKVCLIYNFVNIFLIELKKFQVIRLRKQLSDLTKEVQHKNIDVSFDS